MLKKLFVLGALPILFILMLIGLHIAPIIVGFVLVMCLCIFVIFLLSYLSLLTFGEEVLGLQEQERLMDKLSLENIISYIWNRE